MRSWWLALPDEERRQLTRSWADDATFIERDEDLAVLLEPRFIDPSDREVQVDREEVREARRALLEWVSGHPELRWGLTERTFHICQAHRRAREVVRKGRLPADFRCPLARSRCPLRRLLDERPGLDVELSVVGLRRVTNR